MLEQEGKIIGTYYLTTDQDGPAKSVCDCGYMVSSDAFTSITDVAVALCNKLGFDIIGSVPLALNHPTLRLVDAFITYK